MSFAFGPQFRDEDRVEFRLFAPLCAEISLQIEGREAQPMRRETDGFFSLEVEAAAGARYGFRFPDGRVRPDPSSRFQPDGVHALSELVETPARALPTWKGLSQSDLILYELHLGTFTEAGTYESAIDRLDELVTLGVTAIELMPLAQSAGDWNWGYDGVNLFAPRQTYGRPTDLRALIDAAHARGLAIILDVVYNHFGPEGNYLGEFGGYTSKSHRTPWGDAPNFDGEHAAALRAWILENARYWVEDYGFDGLRLDATHFMLDHSTSHIVTEMGQLFDELNARLGREVHLIAESNVYDPELLTPVAVGGHGFDALWCDDFQHAVYGALRPDEQMTSREYRSGHDLELVLRRGYIFQGSVIEPPVRHDPTDFPDAVNVESLVVAIQHHDFIGNHPSGLRLHQITSLEAQRAAAVLMLLSPSIPMLFMGEEFAAEAPFYFFVDFQDAALRRAVERGRRADHPQHDWSLVESATSPAAFEKSKIGDAAEGDTEMHGWYRSLIEIRKQWRADGFLDSTRMTTRWDAKQCVAYIAYEHSGETRSLLVRLHPFDATSRSDFTFDVAGEILLRQSGSYPALIANGSISF